MTRWQCRGCEIVEIPCTVAVYEYQGMALHTRFCPIFGNEMVFIELTDEEEVV